MSKYENELLQNGVCGRDAHAHDSPGQRRHGRASSPVMNNIQTGQHTGERRRERGDDDEGVEPGLKVDDYDHEIDSGQQSPPRARNRAGTL